MTYQLNTNQTHLIIEPLDAHTSESLLRAGNSSFEERMALYPNALVGVAEGDSWFDYKPAWLENPVRGDLLGHLNTSGSFNIYRISKAGDTVENMVYGTDHNSSFQPGSPQLTQTLAEIRKRKPKFFLFSGGGNDIAGQELEGLLNHSESGLPLTRDSHVDYIFNTYLRSAYEALIKKIKEVSPDIHIFLHGYDHAIPDGRAVVRITPDWQYIGPWLRPAFTKKRILELSEGRRIIRDLTDRFNTMLSLLAQEQNVHYIDLRGTLVDTDWANELHPTARGFSKVASKFETAIKSVINS